MNAAFLRAIAAPPVEADVRLVTDALALCARTPAGGLETLRLRRELSVAANQVSKLPRVEATGLDDVLGERSVELDELLEQAPVASLADLLPALLVASREMRDLLEGAELPHQSLPAYQTLGRAIAFLAGHLVEDLRALTVHDDRAVAAGQWGFTYPHAAFGLDDGLRLDCWLAEFTVLGGQVLFTLGRDFRARHDAPPGETITDVVFRPSERTCEGDLPRLVELLAEKDEPGFPVAALHRRLAVAAWSSPGAHAGGTGRGCQPGMRFVLRTILESGDYRPTAVRA